MFELIVIDEIVDHIVTYSNVYVNHSTGNKELQKTSRLSKWEGIAAPEIRLYLAALTYHRMLYKPKEHLYYVKKKLFEAPVFRRIRSQNKIVLLGNFLHSVYNEELGNFCNKSPFSCGRGALVGNNTFLKRNHVSDSKHLFYKKDIPATFGMLLCTQVVICCWAKSLIPITMEPR